MNMCSVSVCSVMDSMSIRPGMAVLSEEEDESEREGEGGSVERETMVRIAVVISSREV